jgi:small nuclear ribonucleoprotein (snRNP)-like protein
MDTLRRLSKPRPKLSLTKPWSHHQRLAELKGKRVSLSLQDGHEFGSLYGQLREFDQWSILLDIFEPAQPAVGKEKATPAIWVHGVIMFKHAILSIQAFDSAIHGDIFGDAKAG